jgi:hypothetical protein
MGDIKRTRVANYANRYVEIGQFHLYPGDVPNLSARLKEIIRSIEDKAYQQGQDDAKAAIRRAMT